jgi:hypothetical protein
MTQCGDLFSQQRVDRLFNCNARRRRAILYLTFN